MTASTSSFYNHQPLVMPPPHEAPPKHDDQQQKDKQKKRKKNKQSHNDGKGGEKHNGIGGAGAAKGGLAQSTTGTGTPAIVIGDEGTDEENSDDEEEADRSAVVGSAHKKPKKQHEAVSSVSRSSTPLAAYASGNYSRLILRLPNKASSSSSSAVASTSAQPSQATSAVPAKKASVPRTKKKSKKGKDQAEASVHAPPISIRTSPNHPQPADESGEIPDFSLAPTFTFSAFHSGDSSSNDFSDLENDDDDEGNVRGSEEAFLIAEKLKRMERKQRRQARRQSRTASDNEPYPIIGDAPNVIDPSAIDDSRTGESVLFEIARIRRMSDVGQRLKQSSSSRPSASPRQGRRKRDSGPVTWSGGEESELGELDELLGLTADDFAAFSTLGGGGVSDDETANSAPMRFEDFLAEDDGDESDSNSSDDESSSSDGGDEAGYDYNGETEDDDVFLSLDGSRVGRDSQAQETDGENEHIATTREVVQNGGFVFYRPGPDESTEDDEMTDDCLPEEADDGGDTTDTLDDTDHVGLVRFGIEAIDKDDEDTEEALQLAMRDRTLVDARNMGLSISIDALAEQPELVIAKTARSLGVSSETAAKILTSVGMSLLMNSGGDSSTGQSSLQRKQERRERRNRIAPKPVHTEVDAGAAPIASTSAVTVEEHAQPGEQAPLKYVPVLGDFEPAGEADLCVVVGQSEMPAPSPFSARKKRRPRTFTNGSPSVGSSGPRGQSVLSSVSSQSFTSALPHHFSASSEEQYDIVLDIDDLVDPSMLPGGVMSSVSEEDEDELDDSASVSTALVHSVGDTSRWNRVPIGAFRSAHPQGSSSGPHHYAQLATAFFSGTRDPAVANTLSFHGGVAVSRQGRKKRYIPVSPVLFPVGQPLKAISHAKSRKDKRKERKKGKIALRQRRRQLVGHNSPSRPSDGLYVSPLFPGVASGLQIPPLSLD